MTLTSEGFTRPPRLVVRTLVATFAAIVLVLVTVFVTLTIDSRARVTYAISRNLEAGQRAFAAFERRRQQDVVLQAATLAESPTLKASLDTYQAEVRFGSPAQASQLRSTIQHEAEKLASRVSADAVVVVDARGEILASGGRRRSLWEPGSKAHGSGAAGESERVVERSGTAFRAISVPLSLDASPIGTLLLASALDAGYVRELSELSRAETAVVLDGRVIATTLTGAPRRSFESQVRALPEQGTIVLAGDTFAIRRVFGIDAASFFAIESIGAAAVTAQRDALQTLAVIGLGALGLGAVASFWLARTLARPIDGLSRELKGMVKTRSFTRRLPRSGSSEELDTLTDTFNDLITSLQSAEAQTELAYLGAIKALAAALDARDPYTAGHSERVSALSVMIGECMGLDAGRLEVLRLGALLHDIGKIGIRDRVLTKNGPLTDEEFEIIKTHPTVGAHILRQVPFLNAHIPIVELHHERPDGRGYPHGLLGEATPLLARIVHVADAFDAMTSARAYRPAQAASFALEELRRYRGSQFDPHVVDAFVTSWENVHTTSERSEVAAIAASTRSARNWPPLDTAVGE